MTNSARKRVRTGVLRYLVYDWPRAADIRLLPQTMFLLVIEADVTVAPEGAK